MDEVAAVQAALAAFKEEYAADLTILRLEAGDGWASNGQDGDPSSNKSVFKTGASVEECQVLTEGRLTLVSAVPVEDAAGEDEDRVA